MIYATIYNMIYIYININGDIHIGGELINRELNERAALVRGTLVQQTKSIGTPHNHRYTAKCSRSPKSFIFGIFFQCIYHSISYILRYIKPNFFLYIFMVYITLYIMYIIVYHISVMIYNTIYT